MMERGRRGMEKVSGREIKMWDERT